ncbi:MAG: hypothetical protein NTU56_14480 [Proteobacteria bacterium]|nr:hypothetical protein [Pseudomonadota bacterium]
MPHCTSHVALDVGEHGLEFGFVADRGEGRIQVTRILPVGATPACCFGLAQRCQRLGSPAGHGVNPRVGDSRPLPAEPRNLANELTRAIAQNGRSLIVMQLLQDRREFDRGGVVIFVDERLPGVPDQFGESAHIAVVGRTRPSCLQVGIRKQRQRFPVAGLGDESLPGIPTCLALLTHGREDKRRGDVDFDHVRPLLLRHLNKVVRLRGFAQVDEHHSAKKAGAGVTGIKFRCFRQQRDGQFQPVARIRRQDSQLHVAGNESWIDRERAARTLACLLEAPGGIQQARQRKLDLRRQRVQFRRTPRMHQRILDASRLVGKKQAVRLVHRCAIRIDRHGSLEHLFSVVMLAAPTCDRGGSRPRFTEVRVDCQRLADLALGPRQHVGPRGATVESLQQ